MKSIESRKSTKTMKRLKSTLLGDNSENAVITDSVELLRGAGFDDCYIEQFTGDAVSLLDDYAKLIGEGSGFEYVFMKRISTMELRLYIQGTQYDPFKNGAEAKKRSMASMAGMNMNTATAKVSYRYAFGYNVIAVSLPLAERRKSILQNPIFIACILGFVLGFLCQLLPDSANSFIVNKIASPLMSVLLSILAGIMGPVIFISMITSIIAMDSVNDLTDLGSKIIRRFIVSILFLIVVSAAVSGLFFRSFGTGDFSFDPEKLVQLILDVIPTNPLRPFLENKTPQLVILGFLLGSSLLILGDRVGELKDTLRQINELIMSVMKIVLTVVPAIPFLSIFTSVAGGNAAEMLQGWKFIVASYIAFTVCVVVKLVKTSMTTGIRISKLWSGILPVVKMAFTTGSTSAPIRKSYEISESEFNIKPEFTSFWIPMCCAMLSPKTAINVVIAAFMVAEMTGIAISISFLLVLVLVTLELSIASPGTTSAWTIVFATLSMPTSYVGLFTVYRLFTANYGSGCTEAFDMLEEVEAAYKLGGIRKDGAPDAEAELPAEVRPS